MHGHHPLVQVSGHLMIGFFYLPSTESLVVGGAITKSNNKSPPHLLLPPPENKTRPGEQRRRRFVPHIDCRQSNNLDTYPII